MDAAALAELGAEKTADIPLPPEQVGENKKVNKDPKFRQTVQEYAKGDQVMTVHKYSIYHTYYVMNSVPSKPDGVDFVVGQPRRYSDQARVRCSTESRRAALLRMLYTGKLWLLWITV